MHPLRSTRPILTFASHFMCTQNDADFQKHQERLSVSLSRLLGSLGKSSLHRRPRALSKLYVVISAAQSTIARLLQAVLADDPPGTRFQTAKTKKKGKSKTTRSVHFLYPWGSLPILQHWRGPGVLLFFEAGKLVARSEFFPPRAERRDVLQLSKRRRHNRFVYTHLENRGFGSELSFLSLLRLSRSTCKAPWQQPSLPRSPGLPFLPAASVDAATPSTPLFKSSRWRRYCSLFDSTVCRVVFVPSCGDAGCFTVFVSRCLLRRRRLPEELLLSMGIDAIAIHAAQTKMKQNM